MEYDWLFSDTFLDESTISEPIDEPIWTTSDGNKIPLSKMTNSHILNCINKLRGTRSKWLEIFRDEYKRRKESSIKTGFYF